MSSGQYLMPAAPLANPCLTRFNLGRTAWQADPWAGGGELARAFSLRELDLLDGVLRGYANREIRQALHLVERTVKDYMNAVLRKLGAADRVAVLRRAIVAGWVNVGPRPTAMADRGARVTSLVVPSDGGGDAVALDR